MMKKYILSMIGIVFLTSFLVACQEGMSPEELSLSIEPLELSSKEKTLISKTGVSFIEYFTLNGQLKETDDLVYELEIYRDGQLEGNTKSFGSIHDHFENEMVSFGMMDHPNSNETTIIFGSPGGLASTSYEIDTGMSTYASLLSEKITLTKNKPVYLAGWMGTNENSLTGFRNDNNGSFPEGIKESDLAFLFKVTLMDQKDVD